MKAFTTLFFALLLTCLLAANFYASTTTYPQFGGSDHDFYTADRSLWNENNDDYQIDDTIALTQPQFIPLVDDLDGDGTNEIIILDDGTVGLYHINATSSGNEFVTIIGYATAATETGNYFSNLVVYDLDGDGYKEVHFVSISNDHIYRVEYNGTHFYDEGFNYPGYFLLGTPLTYSSDAMIGCGDPDGCVFIYNDRSRWTGSGTRGVYAVAYNATNYTNRSRIHSQDWSQSNAICLPRYKHVPYYDDSYYFTFTFGVAQAMYLAEIFVNGSGHVSYDKVQNAHGHLDVGNSCRLTNAMTSPIVLEHEIVEPGKEIGYGYVTSDSNQFKAIVYNADLTENDEYPEVLSASGELISNPVAATAFTDTERNDLCVVGYEDDEEKMIILCGSKEAAGLPVGVDNIRFAYTVGSSDYNVTLTDHYAVAIHAIESKQNDLSEIMTPLGVFQLENQYTSSPISNVSCATGVGCDAYKIWDQPAATEIAVVPVDPTESGFDDLLMMTSSNLYYMDDGFQNQNAYIGYCTRIEPSIDAVWALHEEGSVEITPIMGGESNPTSFAITDGKNEVGSYLLTQDQDDNPHSVQEDGRDFNVTYNITDVCTANNFLEIKVRVRWRSATPSDYMLMRFYNYASGLWEPGFVITNQSGNYRWFSINVTPEIVENYTQNNQSRVMFADWTGTDTSDDYFDVDYISFTCWDTNETVVPGSQTNEVRVRVKPVDPEGDLVNARVILYNSETNQQDSGWSINYSSGTEIPFSGFRPNETTSSGTLRIMVRDAENHPDTPIIDDYSFIVAQDGDFRADSNSCEGQTEEEYEAGEGEGAGTEGDSCTSDDACASGYFCGEDNECHSDATNPSNALNIAMNEFSGWTGLSTGLVFLIVLGVLVYGLFLQRTRNTHPGVIIAGAIATIGIGAIIGAKMGFVSTGTIIVLVLIAIIIGGFMFGKMFIGGQSTGGG